MTSSAGSAMLATVTTQTDEQIRQEIALLVDGADARFSIQLEQGRVTLFGAPEHQQELAELAEHVVLHSRGHPDPDALLVAMTLLSSLTRPRARYEFARASRSRTC